jgi:hypothetical protein
MADDGCPNCGYVNPLGARFCSSCGIQLRDTTGDEATMIHEPTVGEPVELSDEELAEMPPGTIGMFVVRHGPKRGSRIALDAQEVTIGRHPESDIFLDDVTVSRRHALVRRVGSGYHVEDAGSLNGTYVNQTRVEHAALNDGDEVQVGKFKLVYVALGIRD